MSGVLRNIANKFSFSQDNDDDDYFLDNEYDYDQEDDDNYYSEESESSARPSFFGRKSNSDRSQTQKTGGFLNRKIVPIDGGARDMEVTMIKPTSMDDSRNICDQLLDGKAVVLNMEGMNTDTAQRIIDFTLGAIYSMDGDLQMISQFIFIATPRNVELSGDFQSNFQNMVAEKNVKPYSFGGMRFNG